MLVPEQIFQFTRTQDLVSQHFEVVRRVSTIVLAPGGVYGGSVFYAIPNDRVLIVSSAWAQLLPRAEVNLDFAGCAITFGPAGYPEVAGAFGFTAGAGPAGVYVTAGWQGQLIIPGGNSIGIRAGLRTGTVGGQTIEVGFYGVSLPRGNIVAG